MSTAVKLDMIPSEEISEYAQKAMLNNPFENFKIENYKYAQLHKSIATNSSLEAFNPDFSSINFFKNLKLTDSSNADLLGDLNKWNYNNSDSYFRVNSILKRSSKKIDLDLYEDEIIYLDLSIFKENIQLLKCKLEAAGHGGMSGRDNAISELSEEYSFILKTGKILD